MLLIGNFGDGVINGYDPTSGVWAGSINNSAGTALANAGLWGIQFGNGVQNQMVNTLYFVAGISAETGGLYGRIDLGATAPDTVAPTVSLTAPAAGTVSGTVTLTANATDNVGVTEVRFLVRVGTTTTTVNTDTTAPYSYDWNSASIANGAATLSAQAVDAAGNVTTSATVAVTVNNVVTPPAPTLATLQTSIFGTHLRLVPFRRGIDAARIDEPHQRERHRRGAHQRGQRRGVVAEAACCRATPPTATWCTRSKARRPW